MVFGIKLIDSLKSDLEQNNAIALDREQRLSNQEMDLGDCFVSIASNSLSDSLIKAKLNILADKGTATFEKLCDLEGNVLDAWIIQGKFGPCWMLSDAHSSIYGKFVSVAKRAATYAKKGLKVMDIELPAWASLKSPNGVRGFSGLSQVYVNVFESHTNYFTGESVK